MIEYKIETLEHFGLVSSTVDELGIVESIDKAIKQDDTKLRDEIEAKVKEALGITNMLTMDNKEIKKSNS